MAEDRFVEAPDGVQLAVRDNGGPGAPLVLLHSLGADLLSVGYLARHLAPYRVVSMDARWSGQSGDSPTYSWDILVSDVEAVVSALALGNPPIVGHSWGGMIAAHYGARHPKTPAVVNLDGHGLGDASLYDGMTPEDVASAQDKIWAATQSAMSGEREGDKAWLERSREEARTEVRNGGVPEELVEEFAARSFVALGDGRWRRHPSPTLYEGLAGDLRMFDLYKRVECPLLIVNATAFLEDAPADLAPALAAYRRGLTRAVDELARTHPNVHVSTVADVDHEGLVARGAPEVARHVKTLLSSVGYEAE